MPKAAAMTTSLIQVSPFGRPQHPDQHFLAGAGDDVNDEGRRHTFDQGTAAGG